MINILNKYKINHAEFFGVLKAGTMHVKFSQIKGRLGFTLVEVLITLGIIGVVAAITIPNLIANQQKKAIVSGMIEAQSILNQALRSYAYDSDEDGTQSFETTLPIKDFAEKYFVPYLKIARICENMEDGCWQTGDFYGYYDLAGVKMTDTVPYSIVLNNGMILGFNKLEGGDYALISILVDTNGKGKRNVLGKDVQSFYLYQEESKRPGGIYSSSMKNGIYPGGYDAGGVPHVERTREALLSTRVSRGCNKGATNDAYEGNRVGVGAACAAVIFKDGWKISNDYPWN